MEYQHCNSLGSLSLYKMAIVENEGSFVIFFWSRIYILQENICQLINQQSLYINLKSIHLGYKRTQCLTLALEGCWWSGIFEKKKNIKPNLSAIILLFIPILRLGCVKKYPKFDTSCHFVLNFALQCTIEKCVAKFGPSYFWS